MRYKFLFISIFAFACSSNEPAADYPDCIREPEQTNVSKGCGNIFVYQFIDSSRALTVSIDAEKINLTKECKSINLAGSGDYCRVILEMAGNAVDSIYFNYCNDVGYINSGRIVSYTALKGMLNFSVSEDNPLKEPEWRSNYRTTIEINNLEFYDNNHNLVMSLGNIVFWNVTVGWLPG